MRTNVDIKSISMWYFSSSRVNNKGHRCIRVEVKPVIFTDQGKVEKISSCLKYKKYPLLDDLFIQETLTFLTTLKIDEQNV